MAGNGLVDLLATTNRHVPNIMFGRASVNLPYIFLQKLIIKGYAVVIIRNAVVLRKSFYFSSFFNFSVLRPLNSFFAHTLFNIANS